ncbi:MAG TPA: N-acetylmuramoyl-L-alanine amidase [Bryobacterales bacterium]|nr:N-acetylmuramoyl-L-alanine amidase [Bryobacterales bacterium]
MLLIRQKRPGACVRTAGVLALLGLSLPAFAPRASGASSDPYSYAELLLEDLRTVPEYELGPKQYLLVIGAFEKVAEKHAKHPKTDKSLLVRGELYAKLAERFDDKSHREKAIASYRELLERFRDSPLRAKALTSLSELGGHAPEPPVNRREQTPAVEVAAKAESVTRAPATGEAAIHRVVNDEPAAEDASAGEMVRPANFVRPDGRSGPAVLDQVRFWTQQGYTRVVIELDDATGIRYDRVHKPERMYIDFTNSRLARALRPTSTIEVGDGLLQRIRLGQNRRDVARVVFDLDHQAHFTTSWLSNPPRLVVELRRTAPEVPAENQVLAENPAPSRQAVEAPVVAEEQRPEQERPEVKREARLIARASSLDFVLTAPRDAYVPPAADYTDVAGKIDQPAPAMEIMAETAGMIDPGRAPSVETEEIPSPFFDERDHGQDQRPAAARERFELTPPRPPTPSRQAVASAGHAPAVSAAYPAVDLSAVQEPMLLAKLETPPAPETQPPPKALDLPAPQPAKATSLGDRNLIRALGLKVGRIVIDPGHGGHDTGTIGAGKLREKDLVNDIAQRLGKLIGERLGSEVIYTRQDDRFVHLRERTKIANNAQADLFISIHANSARQRAVRGIETFYLNLTTDSWAMAVAARENAASEQSVHELENLVSKITRNENLSESREFAAKVQGALYDSLSKETKGIRNRGVRKAPLMVLIGAKMPAILAEISFLSNASDEKLLKTSEHRDKIAEALFEGISAYADTLGSVTVTEKATTTARNE